ncbi:MAG: protein-L-isoaspartate O-methyltransferase [Geminicoccaceae bacterium]|nr:MAG: protein-L-isoaspartate O-methyltransferase [Geminicoccaceae bacterium]
MDDLAMRRNMIENQLRPSNVADPRVLVAMGEVPRPPFLPAHLKAVAYSDDDLVMPDGRFLIEPLVIGRMLQVAETKDTDTALVVGCDTGYVGCVLAKLAGTVFSLVDPAHLAEVEARIDSLEAINLFAVPTAAGLEGHAERAPYDVILVIGYVPEVPAPLLAQLAEGGRLVAVVGSGRIGRGTVVTRIHDHWGQVAAFDAAIPRFRGLKPKLQFQL